MSQHPVFILVFYYPFDRIPAKVKQCMIEWIVPPKDVNR